MQSRILAFVMLIVAAIVSGCAHVAITDSHGLPGIMYRNDFIVDAACKNDRNPFACQKGLNDQKEANYYALRAERERQAQLAYQKARESVQYDPTTGKIGRDNRIICTRLSTPAERRACVEGGLDGRVDAEQARRDLQGLDARGSYEAGRSMAPLR
mgnify:CR=1 FL=1